MKKILPTGEVNPREHLYVPLWVVYGITKHHTQIRVMCCNEIPGYGVNIWGYSEYKNSPAYRTDGVSIDEFIERSTDRYGFNPSFFIDQNAALDYLKRLTTPRCEPISKR
jgi:hypothetical protein